MEIQASHLAKCKCVSTLVHAKMILAVWSEQGNLLRLLLKCLKVQASTPDLLVGKLSKLLYIPKRNVYRKRERKPEDRGCVLSFYSRG